MGRTIRVTRGGTIEPMTTTCSTVESFGAIFENRFAAVSSAAGVVPLTICGSVCSSVIALPCTTRSGQNATFVERPRALR